LALREKAAERGEMVPAALPPGESSWTQWLLWQMRFAANRLRQRMGSGWRHTVFANARGQLLSWGTQGPGEDDEKGVLGHDQGRLTIAEPTPVPLMAGVRVVSVASGMSHTLALTDTGLVFSFGSTALGHGDLMLEDQFNPKTLRSEPVELEAPQWQPRVIEALRGERVTAVAAGGHSLVLTATSDVLSFGVSSTGELGHGADTVEVTLPTTIEALRGQTTVALLAAGIDCSFAVTEDGLVLSFGRGGSGVLGHGNQENQYTPKVIEALRGERVEAVTCTHSGLEPSRSLVITAIGEVFTFGAGGAQNPLGHGDHDAQFIPKRVEALVGLRVVAASISDHALVVTKAGDIFSFGRGDLRALGHGDEEDQLIPKSIETLRGQRVTEVFAGEGQSLCVLEGGRVYGWGYCCELKPSEDALEDRHPNWQMDHPVLLEYPALCMYSLYE
jgi:alpha-tubulin suppressor-like RCC1 family protein